MFQNNKVAKIANIIEIKNNPSNNTVLGKFSMTLPYAQYIMAYSESSDVKHILQINSDGNIVAPLGISNGVYWIDSMFLVN